MRLSRIAALCICSLAAVGAAAWISARWIATARSEALVNAVMSGEIARAERLLATGEDPNIRVSPYPRYVGSVPFTRPTLLVVAVAQNDLEMAKMLLQHHASPQVQRTPKDRRTLAQVANTLPAPWPRLLNNPAYAPAPLPPSPPEVNLHTLRRRGNLPICLTPAVVILLGVVRIWQGLLVPDWETRQSRTPITQGALLALLGLVAFVCMPTIC